MSNHSDVQHLMKEVVTLNDVIICERKCATQVYLKLSQTCDVAHYGSAEKNCVTFLENDLPTLNTNAGASSRTISMKIRIYIV